jgi:hypothetical protein
MSFQRKYSTHEVRGMLKIFEGNRAIQSVNHLTHKVNRANAAAHATIHAGASRLDQAAVATTSGESMQDRRTRKLTRRKASFC